MNDVYKKIATLLKSELPNKWDKAWIYIEYDKNGNNDLYSCYLTPRTLFSKKKYEDVDINGWNYTPLFNKIRNTSPNNEKWSTATFILNKNDKMEMIFGYTDLEKSNVYDRRIAWEKKFL